MKVRAVSVIAWNKPLKAYSVMIPSMQSAWPEVKTICAALGVVGVAGGVVWGIGKFIVSKIQNVLHLGDNVSLLLNNHVPHLQTALDENREQMVSIASDVRSLDTKIDGVCDRLEDTRKGMHTLGDSFIRHLENASRETIVSTANIAENKLKITAIEAATKLAEATPTVVVQVQKET